MNASHGDGPPIRNGRRIRRLWPAGIWFVFLVPPSCLVAYAGWRQLHGPRVGYQLAIATTISLCFVVVGLAIICRRSGREWLFENRFKFLLAFSSTLFAWAVLDVALTVTQTVPTLTTVRDRSLLYRPGVSTVHRLVPNRTVINPDRPVYTINRRGFRGPDTSARKPPGITRWVFLGGSQVFDQNGAGWPETIGKHLSSAGFEVDIVNAGVPGHMTGDSLGKFITELWLLQPDIVVLCQTWNDIKYLSDLNPEVPYRDLVRPPGRDWRLRPTGLDRILCASATYRLGRLRFIQTLIGAEGGAPRELDGTVKEWGLRQFRLNVELLCVAAESVGARVVLCQQARLPTAELSDAARQKVSYHFAGMNHEELLRAFTECDRILEEVAQNHNCQLIDMNAELSGRPELFSDHIHFSLAGSEQAARFVADRLLDVIQP